MNVEALAGQIQATIEQVRGAYSQLVLVVGPAGSGKTAALRHVANHDGYPYRNVSLELSRRLLDVEAWRRPAEVAPLVRQFVEVEAPPIVLLDNLELLFEPSLAVRPVALLQTIARNRVVVATWTGTRTGNTLSYAQPGHREYVNERADGVAIVESAEGWGTG